MSRSSWCRRCWRGSAGPRIRCGASAESFLKLVAIATVADVVPLTGENRIIVTHGLRGLDKVRNPGLRALLDVAGFTGGTAPNARQVAFQIAPRINAAGRMDTAKAVGRDVPHQRRRRAPGTWPNNFTIRTPNASRWRPRSARSASSVAVDAEANAALVYYGEDWHRGVLGIVASRLVERFTAPCSCSGRNADDGLASGSGRSIPAFHLLDALESMSDLFVRFGGHAHAAGVTMDAARVEEFRRRFDAYAAARLCADDFLPRLEIDARARTARDQGAGALTKFSRWPRSATATSRRCSPRSDVEVAGAAGRLEREAPPNRGPPERPDPGAQGVEPRPPRRRARARHPRGSGLQSRRGCLLGRPRLSPLGRHPARFPRRPESRQASVCRQTVRRHRG